MEAELGKNGFGFRATDPVRGAQTRGVSRLDARVGGEVLGKMVPESVRILGESKLPA